MSVESLRVFSCSGSGKNQQVEDLKVFSCFGPDDPQQNQKIYFPDNPQKNQFFCREKTCRFYA
jgi:hypothetical protein